MEMQQVVAVEFMSDRRSYVLFANLYKAYKQRCRPTSRTNNCFMAGEEEEEDEEEEEEADEEEEEQGISEAGVMRVGNLGAMAAI